MSGRYEVWALYDVPVRMSRHWTRRGARWSIDAYDDAWTIWGLNYEIRETATTTRIGFLPSLAWLIRTWALVVKAIAYRALGKELR
jgi:hypothetical protein